MDENPTDWSGFFVLVRFSIRNVNAVLSWYYPR